MAPAGGIGMQRKFFRFRIIQAGGVLHERKGFHGIPQPEEVFFTFQEFSRRLEQQAMKRHILGETGKQSLILLIYSKKIHQKNGKTKRLPDIPGASYNKIWILNEGFVRFWKNHPEKLELSDLLVERHASSK